MRYKIEYLTDRTDEKSVVGSRTSLRDTLEDAVRQGYEDFATHQQHGAQSFHIRDAAFGGIIVWRGPDA